VRRRKLATVWILCLSVLEALFQRHHPPAPKMKAVTATINIDNIIAAAILFSDLKQQKANQYSHASNIIMSIDDSEGSTVTVASNSQRSPNVSNIWTRFWSWTGDSEDGHRWSYPNPLSATVVLAIYMQLLRLLDSFVAKLSHRLNQDVIFISKCKFVHCSVS